MDREDALDPLKAVEINRLYSANSDVTFSKTILKSNENFKHLLVIVDFKFQLNAHNSWIVGSHNSKLIDQLPIFE